MFEAELAAEVRCFLRPFGEQSRAERTDIYYNRSDTIRPLCKQYVDFRPVLSI